MLYLPVHLFLDVPFFEDLLFLHFLQESSDSYFQLYQATFVEEDL